MLESIKGKKAVRVALLSAAVVGAFPALAANRALLIGVGEYRYPSVNDLPGIALDVDIMREVAGYLGYRESEIRVLQDAAATEVAVKRAIEDWLIAGTGPGGHALLYFSGHGAQVPDISGDEVEDHQDEFLILHDFEDRGAESPGMLLDDDIGRYLERIPAETLMVVDACQSGTVDKGYVSTHSFGRVENQIKYYRTAQAGDSRGGRELLDKGYEPEAVGQSSGYVGLFAADDTEYAQASKNGSWFTLGLREAIGGYLESGVQPTPQSLITYVTAFIERELKPQDVFHPQLRGDKGLQVRPLALSGAAEDRSSWVRIEDLVRQAHEQITVTPDSTRTRIGKDYLSLTIEIPTDLPATGGYLNVVDIRDDGSQTVLFPNGYHTDNRVQAGAGDFRFPTPDMKFRLRTIGPAGRSLLAAFITEEPINLHELSGKSANEMFATLNRLGLSDLVKGLKGSRGYEPVARNRFWAGMTQTETVQ